MQGHLVISQNGILYVYIMNKTSYVKPPILKGHFNCPGRRVEMSQSFRKYKSE